MRKGLSTSRSGMGIQPVQRGDQFVDRRVGLVVGRGVQGGLGWSP